jgi:hypothetical protein
LLPTEAYPRGFLLFLLLCVSLPARADTPVRIQAQTAFVNLLRVNTEGGVELRGKLVDDAERALGQAQLELSGASRQVRAQDCSGERALPRTAARSGAPLALLTTGDGSFCMRLRGLAKNSEGALLLRYAGDDFHLPVSAKLSAFSARSTLSLAFAEPTLEFPLEQPEHRIWVKVAATPPLSDPHDPQPLELYFETAERTARVGAQSWTPGSDGVEFRVSSASLGEPGVGRLSVRHRGSAQTVAAEVDAVAFRIAAVRLAAQVLSREGPKVLIAVQLHSAGTASPPGWVEAAAEGARVGVAEVVERKATLALDFGNSGEPPPRVRLDYLSEDPCWVPSAPLQVELLPPRAAGPPVRWPWLALLIPIAYLFFRALQRPGVSEVLPAPRLPEGGDVALLEPASRHAGWTGIVRDAHDASPIAGASIKILSPAAEASGAAERRATPADQPSGPAVSSDAEGRFWLPAAEVPPGARLFVSAPAHTELSRPLPPQGKVGIALVSRRRAIVRRLVDWAKLAGAPWAGTREPTPGDVMLVALRRGQPNVAEWAHGVEAAAFGGHDPDAQREALLRALEPSAQHEDDRKR